MGQEYKSLMGLIFSCTMGKETNSCPFQAIRHLPLTHRLDVLEELPETQKDELIRLHRECFCHRDFVRFAR